MQDASPITAKNAYEALKTLGYTRPYIVKLLPDWWDNSLLKTSAGALQFALILKQRLGIEVRFDAQGALSVAFDQAQTKFKHRRDTLDEELGQAAGIGRAMARLVAHGLSIPLQAPPASPLEIRQHLLADGPFVEFDGLVDYCWSCGIPVLFLDNLPPQTKRAAGMAVNIGGRPVIVLGHRLRQKSRQLFILAHELGHIALNHIRKDSILIDEDIAQVTESVDRNSRGNEDDQEERAADQFALQLLRGDLEMPAARLFSPLASGAVLAREALRLSGEHKIDPGHLLLSWAKEAGTWSSAAQAIGFFSDSDTAIETLERDFRRYSNLQSLSEENQDFLASIQGFRV